MTVVFSDPPPPRVPRRGPSEQVLEVLDACIQRPLEWAEFHGRFARRDLYRYGFRFTSRKFPGDERRKIWVRYDPELDQRRLSPEHTMSSTDFVVSSSSNPQTTRMKLVS
jgi:hypothetical protein